MHHANQCQDPCRACLGVGDGTLRHSELFFLTPLILNHSKQYEKPVSNAKKSSLSKHGPVNVRPRTFIALYQILLYLSHNPAWNFSATLKRPSDQN
jgi:hypothetical protein